MGDKLSSYEIEAKYEITCSRENVIDKIVELGAKPVETCIETDRYYAHPCRDFQETDEALRLRKTSCGTTVKYYLAYKGPRISSRNIKKRLEIEILVNEPSSIDKILQSLGFTPILTFSKHREKYLIGEAVVSIDELLGYGLYLEIETPDKNLIEKIAKLLDKCIKPVDKTYLEICLDTGMCRVEEHGF